MGLYKVTTFFSQTSAISNAAYPLHRVGGWSESVYGNFNGTSDLLTKLGQGFNNAGNPIQGFFGTPGYWPARAALLGVGSSITGARLQPLNPIGAVQPIPLSYAGQQAVKVDIPQMALLMRGVASGALSAVRKFTLRGIPDQEITEGEYQPDVNFNVAMNQFIQSLANVGWNAKSPFAGVKVIAVTTAGIVTTVANDAGVTVGAMRQFRKCRDTGGNLRSGQFLVTQIGPGTNQFTIMNWPWGATTGGTEGAIATTQFVNFDPTQTTVGRAVVRKVGRPSVQYRGRRSKRR